MVRTIERTPNSSSRHASNNRKVFPLGLYRVEGSSMLPTYRSGSLLLGWHWFAPRVGQIIVVLGPEGRSLIKRIKSVAPNGVWVEGDNSSASTDSRQFGILSHNRIEALIIAKLV